MNVTRFTAIFTLQRWSGTEPAILVRYTCICKVPRANELILNWELYQVFFIIIAYVLLIDRFIVSVFVNWQVFCVSVNWHLLCVSVSVNGHLLCVSVSVNWHIYYVSVSVNWYLVCLSVSVNLHIYCVCCPLFVK